MKPANAEIVFPWLSSSLGLIAILCLMLSYEESLQAYLGLSLPNIPLSIKSLMLLAVLSALIWDWRRTFLVGIQNNEQINQLQGQIDELWQQKKQVQRKAHTYSAHTDKLKLFISDKLLEYIEYDEKFLHFKSIAAEVRHNGVISYDKVTTLLESLTEQYEIEAEQEDELADEWEEDAAFQNEVRDAMGSMRYLWDLLDLSTADNIALHINNHVCDCEEHYYSMMLNPETVETMPMVPDFNPRNAVVRTLTSMLTGEWVEYESGALELVEDEQFRVFLRSTGNLLGNENHLVLLLENLIKNAQFFANKKAFRNQFSRIFVGVTEQQGAVSIEVYNRGPNIEEEHRDQIFQLGYSTRRVKEHHGKGLGLYFVHEIVKGYEGRIAFQNIQNAAKQLNFVFTSEQGNRLNRMVQLEVVQGRPVNATAEDSKTLKWEFDEVLNKVEIYDELGQQEIAEVFNNKAGKRIYYDPFDYARPAWVIQLSWEKRKTKVIFTPLNVQGVSFFVQLPTADSRLDGIEHDWEESIDYERLNESFQNFEQESEN